MSDEVLTIKKENVLKAASECAEAKRILEKIFPDAFKRTLCIVKRERIVAKVNGFNDDNFNWITLFVDGEMVGRSVKIDFRIDSDRFRIEKKTDNSKDEVFSVYKE